jgi:hypothetical protein
MPCTIRSSDIQENPPAAPRGSRIQRLQALVCAGGDFDRDDVCLIHWDGKQWVAWVDTAGGDPF